MFDFRAAGWTRNPSSLTPFDCGSRFDQLANLHKGAEDLEISSSWLAFCGHVDWFSDTHKRRFSWINTNCFCLKIESLRRFFRELNLSWIWATQENRYLIQSSHGRGTVCIPLLCQLPNWINKPESDLQKPTLSWDLKGRHIYRELILNKFIPLFPEIGTSQSLTHSIPSFAESSLPVGTIPFK